MLKTSLIWSRFSSRSGDDKVNRQQPDLNTHFNSSSVLNLHYCKSMKDILSVEMRKKKNTSLQFILTSRTFRKIRFKTLEAEWSSSTCVAFSQQSDRLLDLKKKNKTSVIIKSSFWTKLRIPTTGKLHFKNP